MFCNYCGSKIDSQQRQCPHCGSKVQQSEGGVGFWDLVGKPAELTKREMSSDMHVIRSIVQLQEKQGNLEKRISVLLIVMTILLACMVATTLLLTHSIQEMHRDVQSRQDYYDWIIRECETEPTETMIWDITQPEEPMDISVDGTVERELENSYHNEQQPPDTPAAGTVG